MATGLLRPAGIEGLKDRECRAPIHIQELSFDLLSQYTQRLAADCQQLFLDRRPPVTLILILEKDSSHAEPAEPQGSPPLPGSPRCRCAARGDPQRTISPGLSSRRNLACPAASRQPGNRARRAGRTRPSGPGGAGRLYQMVGARSQGPGRLGTLYAARFAGRPRLSSRRRGDDAGGAGKPERQLRTPVRGGERWQGRPGGRGRSGAAQDHRGAGQPSPTLEAV